MLYRSRVRALRALVFLVAAVVLVAVPTQARAAKKRRAATSTAIVAFGDAAKELEQDVRRQVAALPTVTLQPASTTMSELKAARDLGVACGFEKLDCLVKLAVLLRVEQLVAVAGVRQPDGISAELVLVDAALGRETARIALRVPAGALRRASALKDGVEQLLEPDRHFGALIVEVADESALLSVDGEPQLAKPFPRARLTLREGPHDILVTAKDKRPFAARPIVQAGDELVVTAVLDEPAGEVAGEAPRAAAASPLFLTGVVLGVAGGAGLVVLGATTLGLEALLDFTDVGNRQERFGMQTAERVTGVAALVAGLVAAAGVALMLVAPQEEAPAP